MSFHGHAPSCLDCVIMFNIQKESHLLCYGKINIKKQKWYIKLEKMSENAGKNNNNIIDSYLRFLEIFIKLVKLGFYAYIEY